MSKPTLAPINQPTKIDLKEEMQLLGVDVPDADEFEVPEKQAVFLPYQQRWFEDESGVCIAEKSRRTGLTWAEAGRNVLTASKPKKRDGSNVFYVGSKQEMALEYIAACALFARAFNQLAKADVYEQTFWDSEKKEEILTYMIRFPNSGFKIQALSSRPSNLRGLQGDVVIDEAAFHESLDALLQAAMALRMWGSRVRIISTHNGVDNLFNEYIKDAREGKKPYSVHRITLDDALKDGLYKRICFVKGWEWSPEAEAKWRQDRIDESPNKDSANEEYFCIPKQSGGNYLKRVVIEEAMTKGIPIHRLTCEDEWMTWTKEQRFKETERFCKDVIQPLLDKLNPEEQHAFGEDFARSGDLTSCVPLRIRADLQKRTPFVIEIKNAPYEVQKQVVFFILRRLPRLRGAAFDATGNGGYLAEASALEFGIELVECVHLSDNWYAEWMPKLKGELDDHNLEIPRHQNVLDDMCQIKVINGIPKIDKGKTKDHDGKKKTDKRHGDFAVGLCMANRASWMDGTAIEFTALPNGRSENDDEDSFEYDPLESGGGCY
ncbi:terminase large subunit domain-containing protein [Pseudoalteromonas luteoviolacea]|uniref:terminase large subunit domain-containing protein n=1 Tax=Pseudoalteromonas luteoviolacea TaxID=43657 RepID=UPI0011522177|nr:terminase family protein [Pseudoalteromonas luteoviolacea]TQF69561.1 hypothetical protein FLM44_00140 [Pseudoalteromonas luteoviolacea]